MRVAPLFQQTLGGLKVGVDRRLAAHGFDEFFGNLYHLNAEEEPENPDYPTEEEAPLMRAALLPRGVIHSWATDTDTDEVDPRYGPVGKQRVEDTGPLNRKRMETIDDETTAACVDFIRRQHASGTPFFVWMNTTHMHFVTHTKPESLGQAGRWQSPYHDTMIDHEKHVGQLLDVLDELGIAEDTIVIYSTDNGPQRKLLARRRHHTVPQRKEHQLGRRIPGAPGDRLARQNHRPQCVQRDHPAPRLAEKRSWPPPANPTSSTRSKPATPSATRPTKSTSTATTCCPTSQGKKTKARAGA